MSDLQILVLAIVQGLTEFLPISSSGHLILSPYLFGFADQGLAFDVAVHLGSLTAVLVYFRRDVWQIALAWLGSLGSRGQMSEQARLGWMIILATLPVVVAGLAFKSLVEGELRAPWVIAATTIVFGLFAARWLARRTRRRINLGLVAGGLAIAVMVGWVGTALIISTAGSR